MPASDPIDYDPAHRRPEGASDLTVEAAGKVSEAVEWLERARGALFEFHQTLGHLDFQMGDAVEMLQKAGHSELAEFLDREVVGRNVLDGRWTFQIVEEFDDLYYEPIRDELRRLEADHLQGVRHLYESEMKEQRRSRGRSGHEERPPAAFSGQVEVEPGA